MTIPLVKIKMVAPKPFLKWAGGKTQLIRDIVSLIQLQASQWDDFNYIEPFVGGGAVLFSVLSHFPNVQRVVINDINPNLITAYNTIKNTPNELIEELKIIQNKYYSLTNLDAQQEFFLKKREEFNSITCQDEIKKTVLFLFQWAL
jgi:DNA adenine methylase